MPDDKPASAEGNYDPILKAGAGSIGVAGRYDPILGVPISPTVIAGSSETVFVGFNGPADGTSFCEFYYLRIAGTNVDATKKISVGFESAVPPKTVQITPAKGATSALVTLQTVGSDVGTMMVFGRNSNDAPNTWIPLCTFLVQQ